MLNSFITEVEIGSQFLLTDNSSSMLGYGFIILGWSTVLLYVIFPIKIVSVDFKEAGYPTVPFCTFVVDRKFFKAIREIFFWMTIFLECIIISICYVVPTSDSMSSNLLVWYKSKSVENCKGS